MAHREDRKPEFLPAMPHSVPASQPNRKPPADTAADDVPDLFTLPRAAHRLSVSKRTLERLISSGTFPPPVKIGRSSRVPRTDISAYLDQLCRERGEKAGSS